MVKKPHFYRGRFYNDVNDSIRVRFLHMLKTMWIIGKNRAKGCNKKFLLADFQAQANQWVVDRIDIPKQHECAITWLGHAGFLVQIGGFNILTDPVFFEISRVVRRFFTAPLMPNQLPLIDAILISHNHRDHMDSRSLVALDRIHQPRIYVPMGNLQWFTRNGFSNVTEMTWWDQIELTKLECGTVRLAFLPASHWTGRGILDINKTLWGSWMISHKNTNVYFAGDTAFGNHFKAIKEYFSPINIALLPVGPLEPRKLLDEAHLNSEQTIEAFLALGANHLIPMHWGTFMFGIDHFLAPIQNLSRCWDCFADKLQQKTLHRIKCGEACLFSIEE